MKVKNCALVKHTTDKDEIYVVNRMEIDTGFDFNKIRQVGRF